MPENGGLPPQFMEDIRARARELADHATPLSSEQALLLVSLFTRYPSPSDDAVGRCDAS